MVLWDLYYQEIRNFLRTVTITNELFADLYLQRTLTRFSKISIYPQANPYYVRLCGNYTDQDTMMIVSSLDTGESIQFTKANLAIHSRTKNYYHPAGAGYQILCQQYPEQIDLIKAIVCPVPVNLDLWPIADGYNDSLRSHQYQTFQGEYDNDTMMYITHPETLATIPFTKAQLDAIYHTTEDGPEVDHTLREIYTLPSTAYFELLARYPSRYELIHGIINPNSPVDQLVNTKHLSMVGFDDSVLQPREAQSLVNAIRNALTFIRTRWYIPNFRFEEYYAAVLWSMIWYHLHLTLYTQRMENLRTPSVHPLSMWEYLSSVGLTNEYNSGLTDNQIWYLYKNIQHLLDNKGTAETLQKLIDGLLEGMNTTLRAKLVLKDTTHYKTTVTSDIEILSKELTSKTTPLEDRDHGTESLDSIISREHTLKLEPTYSEEVISKQTKVLNSAQITRLPTKLIEIQKFDIDDRERYPFYEFVLHSTIALLNRGYLKTHSVEVTFPDSDYRRYFKTGEALAAFHYIFAKTDDVADSAIVIPTTFQIRSAFKDPVTSTPDTIPIHELGDIPLSQILDPVALLAPIAEQRIELIDSAKDFILQLDDQYAILYYWYTLTHFSADWIYHQAMNQIMFAALQIEEVTLSGADTLVPGFSTYGAWFDTDPSIKNILQYYRTTTAKRQVCLERILNAVYPVENSRFAGGFELSKRQYILLRNLFTQLCSYNVAFLDTPVIDTSSVSLKPVVILNLERVQSWDVNISISKFSIEDDWVTDPIYV
jgi:hypothetical protein